MPRSFASAVTPILVALVAGACTGTKSTSTPSAAFDVRTAAAAERAKAEELPADDQDIENAFLVFEDKLPGFGGMYLDETGAFVVLAPSNITPDSVRAIVAKNASMFRLTPDYETQLVSGTGIKVMPARYPFSYLRAWKSEIEKRWTQRDQILSFDADEKENRLDIGVADSATVAYAIKLAASVGVPADAIHAHTVPAQNRTAIQGE